MEDVRVAIAREADLSTLVEALGQADFFEDRWDRQRRGLGELLIAWVGDRPAGVVYLWREEHPHLQLEANLSGVPGLNHLEVVEAYRRRGVGTALMVEAERIAFEHGHTLVMLGVGVTNPARALYDGRGYDDWGHGLVEFRWESVGPDGVTREDGETCHILLKFVDPQTPDLDRWDAWHPGEIAVLLKDCPAPWAVAGGWAIDLHLGRQTREHGDVEVAIPRATFPAYRRYVESYDLYDVGNGQVRRLLPGQPPDPENHQVWVSEPAVPAWRMDTFLEPGDEQTWISHRDPRVTMPLARAIQYGEDQIPHLAPEIVLFAKAKHTRDKDEADFALTLPTLDDAARRWLADAVHLVHPDHHWLEQIRA